MADDSKSDERHEVPHGVLPELDKVMRIYRRALKELAAHPLEFRKISTRSVALSLLVILNFPTFVGLYFFFLVMRPDTHNSTSSNEKIHAGLLRMVLSREEYESKLQDLRDARDADRIEFGPRYATFRLYLSIGRVWLDNLPVVKAVTKLVEKWTGA